MTNAPSLDTYFYSGEIDLKLKPPIKTEANQADSQDEKATRAKVRAKVGLKTLLRLSMSARTTADIRCMICPPHLPHTLLLLIFLPSCFPHLCKWAIALASLSHCPFYAPACSTLLSLH